jgi:phosphatidate phosphatase APP1
MSASTFTVVSDLDDTLKISHTTNRLRTVFRGLFMHHAYAGMSELYQEWIGASEFILMSSSPNAIRGLIQSFLSLHRFPKRQIWLRDWIKQPNIRKYKTDQMKRLQEKVPGPYIFVGDDSEWDPEVFSKFREQNPEQVLAIYIRRMRGRPLPEGVKGFHTSFELALEEHKAGRLKIPQVARVGKAVLEEKNPDYVIPYFAVCPDGLSGEIFPGLQLLQNSLHERLSQIFKSYKK